MARPRGRRAIARGISRGKIPLDICKVDIRKLKKLSSDALFKVWNRIDKRGGRRNKALGLLAAWASNYGAAKTSVSAYRDDPKQRGRSVRVYLSIARQQERAFRAAQSHACLVR